MITVEQLSKISLTPNCYQEVPDTIDPTAWRYFCALQDPRGGQGWRTEADPSKLLGTGGTAEVSESARLWRLLYEATHWMRRTCEYQRELLGRSEEEQQSYDSVFSYDWDENYPDSEEWADTRTQWDWNALDGPWAKIWRREEWTQWNAYAVRLLKGERVNTALIVSAAEAFEREAAQELQTAEEMKLPSLALAARIYWGLLVGYAVHCGYGDSSFERCHAEIACVFVGRACEPLMSDQDAYHIDRSASYLYDCLINSAPGIVECDSSERIPVGSTA